MRYSAMSQCADDLMWFKYVVKNVALRNGKTATFMPKPLYGDNGSGMHTHMSLWKDGQPLFAGDRYAGLSEMAMWYIGGVLKHAPAILAFTNPTTNSYRRLVPGYEAPINLAYSSRNRSVAVRIPMYSQSPKAKRIEFRTPDPNIDFLLERQREEDPFRVFSMRGGNGQDVRPGMFGLELAGGHHPNDLGRYRELIGMAGSDLPINLLTSANVLRVLNVRYLLWPDQFGAPADQDVLPADITDNLRRLSQTTIQARPFESVYEFTDLPRARLVSDVVVLPDDQTVPHMLSADFDPERQVVLSEPLPIQLTGGQVAGAVEWIERNNNDMTLRVSADRPAVLVPGNGESFEELAAACAS